MSCSQVRVETYERHGASSTLAEFQVHQDALGLRPSLMRYVFLCGKRLHLRYVYSTRRSEQCIE